MTHASGRKQKILRVTEGEQHTGHTQQQLSYTTALVMHYYETLGVQYIKLIVGL